jgi:hypothetical protein
MLECEFLKFLVCLPDLQWMFWLPLWHDYLELIFKFESVKQKKKDYFSSKSDNNLVVKTQFLLKHIVCFFKGTQSKKQTRLQK